MCPFAVDEDRMLKMEKMDLSKPQGLPGGIPVKVIPYAEFPRLVYRHPREPFRKVEHRNAQREVVDIEVVPTEHLTREVKDEKELEKALAEGWVKQPYLPKPAPDPTAYLYEEKQRGKSA